MNVQSNPTATDRLNQAQNTVEEQIGTLRAQVEKLISERAVPYIADVAGQAEDAARKGYAAARENVDALSGHVKNRPLSSVLMAGVAGFLIARMFR